jgi:transcription-repair coupling factor (superfamily II helicase)
MTTMKTNSGFGAIQRVGKWIHIAMKDLEIRGAGDLLWICMDSTNETGFDTYQKKSCE